MLSLNMYLQNLRSKRETPAAATGKRPHRQQAGAESSRGESGARSRRSRKGRRTVSAPGKSAAASATSATPKRESGGGTSRLGELQAEIQRLSDQCQRFDCFLGPLAVRRHQQQLEQQQQQQLLLMRMSQHSQRTKESVRDRLLREQINRRRRLEELRAEAAVEAAALEVATLEADAATSSEADDDVDDLWAAQRRAGEAGGLRWPPVESPVESRQRRLRSHTELRREALELQFSQSISRPFEFSYFSNWPREIWEKNCTDRQRRTQSANK